jgi:hypothetical protein
MKRKRTREIANWRPAPAKEPTLRGSFWEPDLGGVSLFIPGWNLGACDFFHKPSAAAELRVWYSLGAVLDRGGLVNKTSVPGGHVRIGVWWRLNVGNRR